MLPPARNSYVADEGYDFVNGGFVVSIQSLWFGRSVWYTRQLASAGQAAVRLAARPGWGMAYIALARYFWMSLTIALRLLSSCSTRPLRNIASSCGSPFWSFWPVVLKPLKALPPSDQNSVARRPIALPPCEPTAA